MTHDADVTASPGWWKRLKQWIAREPKNRDQLVEVLRDSEERDILSAEALSMVESILEVSDMHVRDVMVPRNQMVTIQEKSTVENILPIVIESAHSRFPVLDTTGEDVVGILLAKDLLPYFFNPKNLSFHLEHIVRPAVFVPESKRLDILLREFRVNRNHIAIVLDEYGHVAGLVTIEDVLEQIVGDIEDEYDIDEEDEIKKHADGFYVVKATLAIDDFNDYFGTDWSDEAFDTIGGLVLKALGHLPKRGETITIDHFRFKILHSDHRRILLLEVTKQ